MQKILAIVQNVMYVYTVMIIIVFGAVNVLQEETYFAFIFFFQ